MHVGDEGNCRDLRHCRPHSLTAFCNPDSSPHCLESHRPDHRGYVALAPPLALNAEVDGGEEQSKKRRSMPDGRHRAQTATETFPPDLVFLAVPCSQTLLAWEIKWRHFGRRSSLQQAALTLHHGRTRFSEKNTRPVFIGALVQIDKIDQLGSFEIHVDGGGQKADRILACQQSSTKSDAALTRDRGKNPHTRARTRKHRTRTCP